MSGGHWKCQQYALNDLLDGVRRDLARAGKRNDFGDQYPDDPRLLAGLRLAEVMLEATDQLVHDLDWCLSGDTSPDTLEGDMKAWREKYVAAIRSAVEAVESSSAKAKKLSKPS